MAEVNIVMTPWYPLRLSRESIVGPTITLERLRLGEAVGRLITGIAVTRMEPSGQA